jgi:hypothetical protein
VFLLNELSFDRPRNNHLCFPAVTEKRVTMLKHTERVSQNVDTLDHLLLGL